MFKSIEEIKKKNKRTGQRWFDSDTLKWWNCTICPHVYYGRYFITAERYRTEDRPKFTVRVARKNGEIETIGPFHEWNTEEDAKQYLDKATLRA